MPAYDEARRTSGREARTWNPSPGESVSGILLGYEARQTESGELLSCVIDDGGQAVRVLLSSTPLLGRFRVLDPAAGESLIINCVGKRPGGALIYDVEYIGPSRVARLAASVPPQTHIQATDSASDADRPSAGTSLY